MRVLLWGAYDTGKPRIRILKEGLRRNNCELIECHYDLWGGIEDKSIYRGFLKKLRLALRMLLSYPSLIWRYLRAPYHDVVLVSYPGALDVLVIYFFAKIRRVPIVWDMFISVYDTVVEDRQLAKKSSLRARFLYRFEKLGVKAANYLLMDTHAHAKRISELYEVDESRISHVWVGVEKKAFPTISYKQQENAREEDGRALKVLFYGQFIPLHGIEYIVKAARTLRNENIDWVLIGKGQEKRRIQDLISEVDIPRLKWIEWVQYDDLITWVKSSDVCLGIFGTSKKADSVIPNKVFQIIASGKPLITRDSTAIREIVSHSPPCVYLTKPGEGESLTDAIMNFRPLRFEAEGCHSVIMNEIDCYAIGKQFLNVCRHEFKLESRQ